MNCKPGDLALVIKGHPRNIAKVVKCIKINNSSINGLESGNASDVWEIDIPLTVFVYDEGSKSLIDICRYPDEALMPISPPDNFANDSESDIINTSEEYYAEH